MSTVVDLETLGSQGFTIDGATAYDRAGFSVSDAGDVNGDGFDDIIVGMPFGEDGDGRAFVIFGSANGLGDLSLANLDPADGFAIQGGDFDYAGLEVSGAGDINGDGFDDVMVSTPSGGFYYGGIPTAYVIFGGASGPGTIDLANLAPTEGFVIEDEEVFYGYGGLSVSAAGDVNGDGFDDMIVGNHYGNGGTGTAYVIFGKSSGFATVNLSALGAADGFAIQGASIYDFAGESVSGAGDVNGDGFDDVIAGAFGNGGAAYVLFGKASGFATIDLANLAPSDGFVVQGAADDQVGFSVSSAGDFNGDGFADIVVGAPGGGDGGSAFVIFGQASGFGTVDLSNLSPADGFLITGAALSDFAGISVSAAGDVNADGFDDIIVGSPNADGGGVDAGEAYVIFGSASGFGTLDLSNLDSADGFVVRGEDAGDGAGSSVSGAGDLNGDGFAEIIVGAPANGDAAPFAGAAYVIFGVIPTSAVIRIGSDVGQTIRGGIANDLLDGRAGNDALFGAAGNDRLFGGTGNDLLDGGTGFDLLSGSGGDDRLLGFEGDDRLLGGTGLDRMQGGAGDDVYIVTDATDFAVERVSEGTDKVFSEVSLWLRANVENLTLRGDADLLGKGNALANDIVGNSGANRLLGDAGDDRLYGQEGNDRLEGGAGLDHMFGGLGDDVYIVTDATDLTHELASEGTDRVYSSIDLQLRSNLEFLFLTGNSDLIGRGNAIANTIVGNSGSNRILAGAGDDRLHGQESNDRLFGEAGADVLNGGGGADWLEGGAGRDQLRGGAGADRFAFRDGDFGGATAATADVIRDFGDAEGDRIRLDLVDANAAAGGDQDFTLIGTGAFSGAAGELRWQQISGDTYVQGDTNGDGLADFWIRLDGLHTLGSDDFIL